MISAIIKFRADFSGHLPASNGYLLLSAVKRALSGTEIFDCFGGDEARKLFTLSCVVPYSFWSRFDSSGEDIVINRDDVMSFRITFLNDEHFELFRGEFSPERMTIGGMGFSSVNIADVVSMDPNGWRQSVARDFVTFRFISPVGFKNSGRQNVLPAPPAVFNSLITKWSNAFGGELSEKYCNDMNLNRIMIDSFDIKTDEFKLKDGLAFRGCVGVIKYRFHEMREDEKRALSWLSKFAFFSGIGYKTTQGMGQAIAVANP